MSESMKTISLLCPTRNRIANTKRLIQSLKDTTTHPERVELLFYVDEDDTALSQYIDLIKEKEKALGRIEVVVGPAISVSQSWNTICKASTGTVLKMSNDDLVYRTKGWDIRAEEEVNKFPDEIYCMWFNDQLHRRRMCTFPILSRKWVDTVGYFTPGIFNFFYNDTWIHNIGKRIGREHYVDNVIVEHLHFTVRKSEFDETYKRAREAELVGKFMNGHRDGNIFWDKEYMREEAAQKLRGVMNK